MPPRVLDDAKKLEFLDRISEGLSATDAAEVMGLKRQRFYEEAKVDSDFATAWEEAKESSTDRLRGESFRRGKGWWEETPVYDRDGNEIGIRKKYVYSDKMLELELKRRDPSYRDVSKLEIDQKTTAHLQIDVNDHSRNLQLAEMIARIQEAGGFDLAKALVEGQVLAALEAGKPDDDGDTGTG